MTRPGAAIRKAVAVMLPWPARHERKAAIEAARKGKERSQAQAVKARRITADIRRMADENHFAAAIADQIIARHRKAGG